MIIFDLDGTLSDCEHRRHFVDPEKCEFACAEYKEVDSHGVPLTEEFQWIDQRTLKKWKPDWNAFHRSCNEDNAIWPVVRVIESLSLNNVTLKDTEIQIWSGRCESVRDRTVHWLKYIIGDSNYSDLKMRPVGDYTSDEVLKEKWLDEALSQGKEVDFVFDDRPKVIRMWSRRGIFVFNCCQHDEEF